MSNYVFYCYRTPYSTIYGKADLSSPKLIDEGEGDTFNIYPTSNVIVEEDCMYYEEGDDVEDPLEDTTLSELNDQSNNSIYRITEEEFEKVKKIALDWIAKYDAIMEEYKPIMEKYI